MRILALLHMYFIVLNVQASNLLPTPDNVTLLSNNFNHILIWSPGRGTPPGTVYSINVQKRTLKTNQTILDISKYMSDVNLQYSVFLSALFGNRSSSVVERNITPYINTIIGPPAVSMSGCGTCFNISVSLPVRKGLRNHMIFYKGISFYIHLRKTGDKKVITVLKSCAPSKKQSMMLYDCFVENLQLGWNYCLQVQPHLNVNENTRASDWFCAFTSTVEEKRVAFVAVWTVCFVLAGLCLLIITSSLVYTRSLCRMDLPKALTAVVPGHHFYTEETQLSVAEVDTSMKSNKTKQVHQTQDDHHIKETKEQTDREEGNEDDEDDDDDNNNDNGETSNCNYMDRGINNSDSQATNSGQSSTSTATTLCEVTENSGTCIEEFPPAEDEPAPTSSTELSQLLHQHLIGNMQVNLADLRPEKPNLPTLREVGPDGGRINRTEADTDHNISLSSVRLMSLHTTVETTTGDMSHAKDLSQPLVPLLIREPVEDRLNMSKPQTGKPTLLGLHMHSHFQRNTHAPSQNEELAKQKDLLEVRSDQLVKHDWTQNRGMDMDRGELDTETDCLLEEDNMEKEEEDDDEEEEDCSSGYMKR